MGSSSGADHQDGTSEPQKCENVTLIDKGIASGTIASSVILGSRVRLGAARRSGLLSAIGDTHGVAELPDGLSAEDVRLWQTASVVSCAPSTVELVKVIQVADVIGDSAADAWIQMLAKRALAVRKPWHSQAEGPGMLCALLQLRSHLRTRVLSACAATHSRGLPRLLDRFPLAFHVGIIACAVSLSGGALKVPSASLDTFLPLLAAASANMPPPGLVSLIAAESMSVPDAAQFAAALVHHSTLTRLTLGSKSDNADAICMQPECIRMLGACLPPASLPRLQTLELSIDAPPGGGGAVAVGTCLRSFTAITSLKICFAYAAAGKSELSNTVSDYVAAATTPAVLPNLETLAIEEFYLTTACRDSVHSVHSGVNLFLPLFAAPAVTQLSFTTNAGLISWPELLCSLQQYSNLQVLTLDADLQAAYAWPDSMRPALAPPSALKAPPALPHLHTLTISSIQGDIASDIGTIMANQAVASIT